MKKNYFPFLIFTFLISLILLGCEENTAPIVEEENDILSGGATTTNLVGSLAFSQPASNLTQENLDKHIIGDALFEAAFVKAPATINPGLGPLFNNSSCVNCHIADGRGRPPLGGEQLETMLFRISINGSDEHNGPNPVPGFGRQLQTRSILGYDPEGSVTISNETINGTYPDGTPYSLFKPNYNITGRIGSGFLYSPRVAPFVFGVGLLEAITEQDILALADENDLNGDGVSGKPNYVWNVQTQSFELGRFGWKANTPNLIQQLAAAYVNDMGVTSPYFPTENCADGTQCDTTSDDPEIDQHTLDMVEVYLQTLAVPSRRNYNDADVKRGKELFKQVGCNSCHTTQFTTGTHKSIPELSNQKIHPYTDLLLHDMGDELADGRPDFDANGNEWRTPPLWGIGLVSIVNGHTNFMHDGRARNLEEAILWHFGEGENSREKFMNLSKSDRESLIKFLNSL
ncbi:MAG: di-heme oxidoredictase family protein [Ignavibacteriaceae bacterium]